MRITLTAALSLLLSSIALRPTTADAQAVRVPRLELGFDLENDKFLLEWTKLPGGPLDTGRTHAARFFVGGRITSHWSVWAHIHTELFSRILTDGDGRELRVSNDPQRMQDRYIHFMELNVFRLGARYDASPDVSVTGWGGLMILNRQRVTPGATGMQRRLHQLVRRWRPDFRQYTYLPDGGGFQHGVLLEGQARYALPLVSGRAARLLAEGLGGARLVTLGKATFFSGALGLRIELGPPAPSGRRWFAIGVREGARLFPAGAVAMLDLHWYASFEGRYATIGVGWDRYHGSANNRMYVYNFNNTTMRLMMSVRVP